MALVMLYPLFWALHYKFFKALYEDDECSLEKCYLPPPFIVGDPN